MPPPDGSSRFDRCRCALAAPREGAPFGSPAASLPYRRCPVGVIADVDCPEFTGARCGYFEDRGDAPPTVVPRTEVPLLAAELAADFLTPRYRRRLAALRAGAAVPAPARADLAADGRVRAPWGVPLNVPADRVPVARRAAPGAGAGSGENGTARESQLVRDAERDDRPAPAPPPVLPARPGVAPDRSP